jgi:FkbM family methyltransferase
MRYAVKNGRAILRRIFWGLPARTLPVATRIRYGIKFAEKIKVRYEAGLIVLSENNNKSSLSKIYFYHPQRVTRYAIGIENRINKLLNEYCVNKIPDLRSGVFLDIGSNIGEFSRGLASRFPEAEFIRFEPSQNECIASISNMSGLNDRLFKALLWKESKTVSFYERNETGDSSIFNPDDEEKSDLMKTQTLDEIMRDLSIDRIELLKLEAEGAEPEILEGGRVTLQKCRYVTADLGPERGTLKEETLKESKEILESYGFALIAQNTDGRKCYLFKNNSF